MATGSKVIPNTTWDLLPGILLSRKPSQIRFSIEMFSWISKHSYILSLVRTVWIDCSILQVLKVFLFSCNFTYFKFVIHCTYFPRQVLSTVHLALVFISIKRQQSVPKLNFLWISIIIKHLICNGQCLRHIGPILPVELQRKLLEITFDVYQPN